MNELFDLILAILSGSALGVIFFGGLWWTVSQGVSSTVPGLWFLGSLTLRMGVVLAGFYWVGHGHWDRMLFCLIGFVLARVFVTRLTQSSEPIRSEVIHAPDLR